MSRYDSELARRFAEQTARRLEGAKLATAQWRGGDLRRVLSEHPESDTFYVGAIEETEAVGDDPLSQALNRGEVSATTATALARRARQLYGSEYSIGTVAGRGRGRVVVAIIGPGDVRSLDVRVAHVVPAEEVGKVVAVASLHALGHVIADVRSAAVGAPTSLAALRCGPRVPPALFHHFDIRMRVAIARLEPSPRQRGQRVGSAEIIHVDAATGDLTIARWHGLDPVPLVVFTLSADGGASPTVVDLWVPEDPQWHAHRSLNSIGIGEDVVGILRKHGMWTVGELVSRSPWLLARIPEIAPHIPHIRVALERVGVAWRDE